MSAPLSDFASDVASDAASDVALRVSAGTTVPPLTQRATSTIRLLLRLPALLLLALIRLYQRTLSPALPILTAGACGCRFSPTCSHYAAEAIRVHGGFRGSWLALRRLVKCTPLHPGGVDPVPPKVHRVASHQSDFVREHRDRREDAFHRAHAPGHDGSRLPSSALGTTRSTLSL